MDHIYKNIEECNSNKKHKILIVFDDLIPDMFGDKKVDPIVTELFIGGTKPSIYFIVTKILG